MRIARKISLSFLITALGLTTIAVSIIHGVVRNNIEKSIFSHLMTAAQSRATHIETLLREHKEKIELMASSPLFIGLLRSKHTPEYNKTLDAVRARLNRIMEVDSGIHKVSILDRNGVVIVSTDEPPVASDENDNQIYLKARESVYISDVHYLKNKTSGIPAIVIAAPLSLNGRFLGVIIIDHTTQDLYNITLDRTGLGETGEIYLINEDAYMITPSRFKEDIILKQKVDTINARNCLMHKDKEKMHGGKEVLICADYRGADVLAAHVYIPEMGWGVLAEIDEKEALAPLHRIERLLVGILLIIPLVAWLIGLLVSKRICAPIIELNEGIEVIGAGDLDYRLPTKSNDEIGQLSAAFNRMTKRLKDKTTSVDELNKEIGHRKQLEEELRCSQQKYRMLFKGAAEGILVADIETKQFKYANPAMCKMLGYTEEELKQMDLPDIHPKEDLEHVISEFEAQARGEKALASNIACLRKDGAIIYADINTTSVIIDGRECNVGFFTDVTERKRAEETRTRLQVQLQQAQRMEAVGLLAGGIAHDFNNVLTPIVINTETALLDVPEASPVRPLLEEILDAAHRARDLVKQILTFTRQGKEERKLLQVGSLVKEGLKFLRASLPPTIEIRQHIKADSATVLAEPSQIHQVSMNLCNNAIYAMRENGGGGVLEVGLADMDVDADSVARPANLKPGPYVRLTVSDTGPGMDPAVREQIFGPFFTTKAHEGTGMGLATMRRIVARLGGAITVDTELGKGSTFEVFFPKATSAAKPEMDSLD